ncbi:MAG: hypothetical protein ACSLEN_03830 [Candidatus Malihini olakiniferum]
MRPAISQHDAMTPLALDVSDRDALNAARYAGYDAAISGVASGAVKPSLLMRLSASQARTLSGSGVRLS